MKAIRPYRRCHGSAIVEGAVAVCMVYGSAVVASLLLINSGCAMFFKTKLTHVNYLAAAYAAAHGGDITVQEETSAFITTMMPKMGLTPNNLTVAVKPIRLQENPAVQVTVSNEFPIFGAACGIPTKITLCDTEIVSW